MEEQKNVQLQNEMDRLRSTVARSNEGETDLRQQMDSLNRQLTEQSLASQHLQEQLFVSQQQLRQVEQEKRLAEERMEDIK